MSEKITNPTKKCNRCGCILPIDDFYLIYCKQRNKSYRSGHCRYCDNQKSKEDYQKHRDKRLKSKKEYYLKDPWNARLRALLRRCKKGYITTDDLKQIVKDSNGKCAYCGKEINGDWTFDHAQPISLEGTNDPENIRVCCSSCNFAKGAKTEIEFRTDLYGVPF